MSAQGWLSLVAAAGFLALLFLCATRRARHPLARSLGLMSVGLFAYNGAEAMSEVSSSRLWVVVTDGAATLTAIPALDLVLGFVGQTRVYARFRSAIAIYFSLVFGLAVVELAAPNLAIVHERIWPIFMLIGLVPAVVASGRLALLHLRRSIGHEKRRARLLIGAMLLGFGGAAFDLGSMLGLDLPRLSAFGLAASSALLAALVLESGILEATSGSWLRSIATVGGVALLAVVLVGALFVWAGDRVGLFLFSSSIAALLLVSAIRPLVRERGEQRARAQYLTTLGRFSQQLAHDVRNPLSAIRGAAQFLQEEFRSGRQIEPYLDMLEMIVERSDRIERLLSDYRRMGRVEPELRAVAMRSLVEDVVRATRWPEVEVVAECEGTLPDVRADADLIAFALENLIRNACEACTANGRVVVRLRPKDEARVELCVIDNGAGMNVRTRELVFDELFTTKDGGTGLGLAFVARVIDSHEGKIFVESVEGQGTTISIELPIWRS